MTSKKQFVGICSTIIFALISTSVANAETASEGKLYLMFNVGDNEDRESPDAGKTLSEAQDGIPPTVIDNQAERYVIHLPGATMNTLAGSATRVGEELQDTYSATASASAYAVAESVVDSASSASEPEGDTGWEEYKAFAASLMLFSPDGLAEESQIRYEPARVFLRRFSDGSVYAAITSEDGGPPPE